MGRASFTDDDSDSDCYGIRNGGVNKQQRRRTKDRKPKDQSVPWTEEGKSARDARFTSASVNWLLVGAGCEGKEAVGCTKP
jgi:hypothetical protein